MKQCSRCKREKTRGEFHKDKSRKDGLSYVCDTCCSLKAKRWRGENPKRHAENSKNWREANPERCRKNKEAWQVQNPDYSKNYSKNNREKFKKYSKKHRMANPEKTLACRLVNEAIKTGKMSRQPCTVCGSTRRIEAHHEDYSAPMRVVWLCRGHHIGRHKERKQT